MDRLSHGRRAAALLAGILLATGLYAGTFVDPLLRADVARLRPARVDRVETIRGVEQLKAAQHPGRRAPLPARMTGVPAT